MKERERDLANRKPYRTKAQKAEARRAAVKCADGTWRSNAPVSFHQRDSRRAEPDKKGR